MLRTKAYSRLRPRGRAHRRPAQALALIIHELGTNAAKYGALSASNGLVTIDWEVAKANVSLTWTERGGPAIPPPSKPGFGTTLITSLLKPLNGSAKMDFKPTGLVCHVSFVSKPMIEIFVALPSAGAAERSTICSVRREGEIRSRKCPETLNSKNFWVIYQSPSTS